ncbi:hypothetical protein Cgig2_026632 [Carnegiea gigantea]|uniref:BHLH domain-containing protein n=1 Tax=Carnegiea gigantea TaxID=171969 RepID=A0A9Q1JHP2_9CARY|nr:hypothetical protein Cgig2_026632 [Carnegiea gigantea]
MLTLSYLFIFCIDDSDVDLYFLRLLTFEDGSFDYLKLQQSCLSVTRDGYPGQEDVINFIFRKKVLGREFNGCPIEFGLDYLSCRQYALGEGLVGRVASTGDDLWIYSDTIGSVELISKLQYPDEQLLLVKAGIKTTLLVSIFPHGVLQLGSLEKISFFILLLFLCYSRAMEELDKDDLSLSSTGLHKRVESSLELRTGKIGNQAMLPSTIWKCLQPDNVSAISEFTVHQDVPYLCRDPCIQRNRLNQFAIADVTEMIEDIWTLPGHEEGDFDAGVPEVSSGGILNYLTSENMRRVPEDEVDNEIGHFDAGVFGGFPRDYDLLVVGAAFQTENDRHSQNSDEENVYLVGGLGSLVTEPSGWSGEGYDQEHLLDAVVHTSSVEMAATAQDTANVLRECTTLSGEPSASVRSVTSPSSFESLTSGVGENKQGMEYPHDFPDENAEVPGVIGKSRPKSSHRPKPRDRQIIQERLKELRELVPKGEKSSVDGLLDQTMKHMFLKNVTEQAEKVKQLSDRKLPANENRETSSAYTFGTSSAKELGDNPGSCPIIVKDLEHPGDPDSVLRCTD